MHRSIACLGVVATAWLTALAIGETVLAEPPLFGLHAAEPESAPFRAQPGAGWNSPPSQSEPISEPRTQPGSGWNAARTQPGSGWNQPSEPQSARVPYSRSQPGAGWDPPGEPAAARSQPGTGWNEPNQADSGWGWNAPQAPARTQPDSGWSQPNPSTDGWGWPAGQGSYPTNVQHSYPAETNQLPANQAGKLRPTGQPLPRNVPPNRAPSNELQPVDIILRNPSDNRAPLHYRIEGVEFRMLPGYKHVLPGSRTYVIEFHCGEPDRIKKYTLYPADYHFTPTDQGWELYRQKARAVPRQS